MDTKILNLLCGIIEKTNSGKLLWEDKKGYLECNLDSKIRVAVNSCPLPAGPLQMRFILELEDEFLIGQVNPWEIDQGYEVWGAVHQVALDSVLRRDSTLGGCGVHPAGGAPTGSHPCEP